MSKKIYTAINYGLNGLLIEVEADTALGLPAFVIVGLADTAVQEAKERVRLAIKNSGFKFPSQRVIINLAPADFPKSSSSLDLTIAVAILCCYQKQIDHQAVTEYVTLGELSLDGKIKPIKGCLNLVCFLLEQGWNNFILPQANLSEARLAGSGQFFPADNLLEVANHFNHQATIKPFSAITTRPADQIVTNSIFDLIKGQEQAKRAAIISAAGGHNLLMIGPPGSGKTLIAKHLAELLPPLSTEESLEVTKIYSLTANLPINQPLITTRPFRSPHHGASDVALIGGGQNSKPGEVTLAHRGILFLDELPEFSRKSLEALRQPLEDGQITIARAKYSFTYPAKLTLIAAANPCPCGYKNNPKIKCVCSIQQKQNYFKKLSGPLLDRIDMIIYLTNLKNDELLNQDYQPSQNIDQVRKTILNARLIQKQRFADNQPILFTNSEMDLKLINTHCTLTDYDQEIMKNILDKYNLSARGYHRVLKVARTIADLENSSIIKTNHLFEAIQYRLN